VQGGCQGVQSGGLGYDLQPASHHDADSEGIHLSDSLGEVEGFIPRGAGVEDAVGFEVGDLVFHCGVVDTKGLYGRGGGGVKKVKVEGSILADGNGVGIPLLADLMGLPIRGGFVEDGIILNVLDVVAIAILKDFSQDSVFHSSSGVDWF